MTEEKNGLVLNKSRAAIAFNSEGGQITHLQHKSINSLLLCAQNYILKRYESYKHFESTVGNNTYDFKVPFVEHLRYTGFRSKASEQVKKAIDSLESLKIHWDIIDENGESDIGYQSLVTRARVYKGQLEFRIDWDVRRALLSDEKTVSMDLLITNHSFRNKYASFLYEQLLNNLKTEGKTEWIVDIDLFRLMMNVPYTKNQKGEREFSYTRFGDLRLRVIEPAISSINETDLAYFCVDYDKITEGNKVTSLRFIITKKELSQRTLFEVDTSLSYLELEGQLNKYNLYNVAEPYLISDKEKDTEYIKFCLDLFKKAYEEKASAGNPITNTKSYFKTMLLNNVDVFDLRWAEILKKQRKSQIAKQTQNVKIEKDVSERVTRQYRSEIVDSYMNSLSEDQRNDLKFEYVEQLDKSSNEYKQVIARGWDSAIVLASFREYLIVSNKVVLDNALLQQRIKTEVEIEKHKLHI
jgi:hypothetical protein